MLFDYDDRSIDSIFEYAKRLEGMTFNEISDEYNHSLKKNEKKQDNSCFFIANNKTYFY